MKCLVLAAGYATRLYPLTENYPKPLLPVGEKSVLDWLIEDIDRVDKSVEHVIISNGKFADKFKVWSRSKRYNVTVIDDKSISNETRLGALKDIQLAIDELSIDEDCIVVAGDNLLDFSIDSFVNYAMERGTSCVMRYFEPSLDKLKKAGVLRVDENDLVIDMTEKPQIPASNWCCPPFYYYIKEDIKLISRAINEGCEVDAPGSYLAWLCKRARVYAMKMPGQRYDIGDIESYKRAVNEYKGIKDI